MVNLEDDIEDAESVNILQEQTLNSLEIDISDNQNDIEGKLILLVLVQIWFYCAALVRIVLHYFSFGNEHGKSWGHNSWTPD